MNDRRHVLALLYTPLHIRSFAQFLATSKERLAVKIRYVGLRSRDKRTAFYIRCLRAHCSTHDIVSEYSCGAFSMLDFRALYWAKKNNAIMFTGNPRRTLSLWLARTCQEVVVLEEGMGTTTSGGYFDYQIAESSRLKALATTLGLIIDYASVVKKITCHRTAYPTSIFRPILHVGFDFEISGIDLSHFPGEVHIVISSWMDDVGAAPYIEIINRLYSDGLPKNSVFFSTHPKDQKSLVSAVCAATGIQVLDLPLILEDLCLALVRSGKRVSLYGDRNSSVLMLNQFSLSKDSYADFTRTR
jgi:hypothetical protein